MSANDTAIADFFRRRPKAELRQMWDTTYPNPSSALRHSTKRVSKMEDLLLSLSSAAGNALPVPQAPCRM